MFLNDYVLQAIMKGLPMYAKMRKVMVLTAVILAVCILTISEASSNVYLTVFPSFKKFLHFYLKRSAIFADLVGLFVNESNIPASGEPQLHPIVNTVSALKKEVYIMYKNSSYSLFSNGYGICHQ